MTTVADVDRLVVQRRRDRGAPLADASARRCATPTSTIATPGSPSGETSTRASTPSAATLAAQHKAFAGWARAFRAVSSRRDKRRPSAPPTAAAAAPVATAAARNRPAARSR